MLIRRKVLSSKMFKLFQICCDGRQDVVGTPTFLSFRAQQHRDLTTLSYVNAYAPNLYHPCTCTAFTSFHPRVPPTPVVGIWLERSIDLHLAILATTISGAAWLPFDADAPTERVSACLMDSNASIILCDDFHHAAASRAVENLPGCQVVTFEQLSNQADLHDRGKRR